MGIPWREAITGRADADLRPRSIAASPAILLQIHSRSGYIDTLGAQTTTLFGCHRPGQPAVGPHHTMPRSRLRPPGQQVTDLAGRSQTHRSGDVAIGGHESGGNSAHRPVDPAFRVVGPCVPVHAVVSIGPGRARVNPVLPEPVEQCPSCLPEWWVTLPG